VVGVGPAGSLGWGVVVERSVSDLTATGYNYRIPAVVFALVLAAVSLLAFLWIRLAVLLPLSRLQAETERVTYGQLDLPVTVTGRAGEIAAMASSLELLRKQLTERQSRDEKVTIDLRRGSTVSAHRARRSTDPPSQWLRS
jgi:HAMP domain-containing protein